MTIISTVLDRLAEADQRSYPAVGLGTDIRLTSSGVVGGALVVEDNCVHMAAFATPEAGDGRRVERGRSTMASAQLRRRRYEGE